MGTPARKLALYGNCVSLMNDWNEVSSVLEMIFIELIRHVGMTCMDFVLTYEMLNIRSNAIYFSFSGLFNKTVGSFLDMIVNDL